MKDIELSAGDCKQMINKLREENIQKSSKSDKDEADRLQKIADNDLEQDMSELNSAINKSVELLGRKIFVVEHAASSSNQCSCLFVKCNPLNLQKLIDKLKEKNHKVSGISDIDKKCFAKKQDGNEVLGFTLSIV